MHETDSRFVYHDHLQGVRQQLVAECPRLTPFVLTWCPRSLQSHLHSVQAVAAASGAVRTASLRRGQRIIRSGRDVGRLLWRW